MMTETNSKIRVLLIDDDEDDFLIIRNIMAHMAHTPFKLEWVNTPEEARRAIDERKHDVYLVDYRLGTENGLELLRSYDLGKRPEPFIILTGAGDERIEQTAMKMGVADYLVKGTFGADLLSRVLRHSIQRKHLETERVQQLVDLNRSKDEFIALASHQLRTPATAVKQYISMVIDGYAGEINEEQLALLQHAYDGNERQLQIVNDILRVAKLDLEKISLKRRPINLSQKIRHVIRDVVAVIKERNQELHTEGDTMDIYIEADAEFLRMALSNILDNASKYTPEGGTIWISSSYKNNKATITIKDTGVGIADEDIEKLFKKFSRIDNPLSVKVGGTGLGLYWSKEIIQMHGGSITVQSQKDQGTTFTVTLPARKQTSA